MDTHTHTHTHTHKVIPQYQRRIGSRTCHGYQDLWIFIFPSCPFTSTNPAFMDYINCGFYVL